MFEAQQTLAAGFAGAIFRCAGDQMGDAEEREGQLHLWFHCVGIRVSDQLERLLAQYSAHYYHLRDLAFAEQFSRLQEMSGLKEKAGDRFVALDSPL